MSDSWETIHARKSTKKKILLAKEEYLRYHPEMRRVRLSTDYVLNQVLDFYLRS